MENYMGMAAIMAAIVLSSGRRLTPVVILFYYAIVLISWKYSLHFIGSIFDPVNAEKDAAAEWYLMQTSIDAIIVISLLSLCRRCKVVLFYCCIVALSALYNTAGLFFSSLSMDWYSNVYSLHQQFAIQLDVAVAWLASDNAFSRKLNRAFSNGAGTSDHEHGKQN